ncbi:uncharacterized protein LOC126766968 [Bactrocera neohumeralis]|uniref:uncharacterized protein LOC126766968 n=1 Tax=Bactrocera neohumeralis TaxID=98809 RepID=UPI0021650F1B|nr:uncharacterized protein LOC126766968 [Bactrocera neohumeralis]
MSLRQEKHSQSTSGEEPIHEVVDEAAVADDDNKHLNKDGLAESDSERDEAHAAVQTIDARGQKPLSEFKRFAMMTAATFAMICASTSYAYNIISGNIQNQYGYKFRDMSNISTVGMVFCYFLLPYGTLLDLFGPRIIYTIGCVLFPLGALLFGLTFQGVIGGSVVRFCVYNAMLSLGSQLFDLASVVVMLSVFPTRKGWVIALLKTMMGLGQAIIACMKQGFFAEHTANYFYFLIALVVVIGVLVQLLVKLPPYHLTNWELKHMPAEKQAKRLATRAVYLKQEPPMWRFYFGVAVLIALVIYLPMTSAIGAFCKDNISKNAAQTFAIIAVVLTCCLLLMMVPFPYLDRLTTKKTKSVDDEEKVEEAVETIEEGVVVPHAKAKNIETDIDYIAPQYQTTFLQSCCTLKLWCILWTMFCGVGAEFVIIFNAKYIYAALNKVPSTRPLPRC